MMKKILVYTYFTDNCYNALKYALEFSLDHDVPLKLVHYYKSPKSAGMLLSVDKRLHDDAVVEMNALKERLLKEYSAEQLQNIEAGIRFGDIYKSIRKTFKKDNADMIIISAKAEYDSGKLFMGSFTGSFIRKTNLPVMVIPSKARYKKPSRILLAVQKPKVADKSMIKPLRNLMRTSEADLSILTISDKKKDRKASLGDHISKLKPISAQSSKGDNIYDDTIDFLKTNEFDILTMIRKKNGFFNNFLLDTSLPKKKFNINFPLLILSGEK